MNTRTLSSASSALNVPIASVRPPAAVRAIFRFLAQLEGGALTVAGPGGFVQTFGHTQGQTLGHTHPGALHVHITLNDWDVLKRCLSSGDIGFAETYMEGRWSCDNLAGLIELFCRNRAAMENAIYGSWLGSFIYRVRHLFNSNTRKQAKKNIEAHYDLGNDFYRLWLDPSMTYSSALFTEGHGQDLTAAQHEKIRRALRALGTKPGERLLEIGCGWGGLAEIAIREFGLHVTGLTLSSEQLAYANERLARAGLSDGANLQLTDYRDLTGQFDHIVSIEMFEAVGEQYWDTYFAAVKRNLKPGGRAVVQSITIDEALFPRYRKSTDFIQQYIFPGGMLPSPTEFRARAAHAGLQAQEGLRFGRDYAETLKRWRASFMAVLPEVASQGFDTRFVRLWEFYLAYCEGAFNGGSTDVIQFDLAHA